MISTKSAPKPGEGLWLWLLKMISGGLIIVFLATHLVINHFTGTEGGGLLSFNEVIQLYTSPGYLVLEILFLATVVVAMSSSQRPSPPLGTVTQIGLVPTRPSLPCQGRESSFLTRLS